MSPIARGTSRRWRLAASPVLTAAWYRADRYLLPPPTLELLALCCLRFTFGYRCQQGQDGCPRGSGKCPLPTAVGDFFSHEPRACANSFARIGKKLSWLISKTALLSSSRNLRRCLPLDTLVFTLWTPPCICIICTSFRSLGSLFIVKCLPRYPMFSPRNRSMDYCWHVYILPRQISGIYAFSNSVSAACILHSILYRCDVQGLIRLWLFVVSTCTLQPVRRARMLLGFGARYCLHVRAGWETPGVAGTQKRARRCRSRFQVAFSPGNAFLLPATSTRTLSPPMAPLADFILSYVPLPSIPYYLTQYVPGKTPMSTPQEVFPTLVAYLVIIFTTQWFMKDKSALKLQIPFQIHNVFLSSGSLLLMSLILEEVIPMVWKNGVFWGMCSTDMWTSVRLSRVVCGAVWCTNPLPCVRSILSSII